MDDEANEAELAFERYRDLVTFARQETNVRLAAQDPVLSCSVAAWRPVLLPWLAHAAEPPCACLRSLAPRPLTARAVQEEQGVAIAQAGLGVGLGFTDRDPKAHSFEAEPEPDAACADIASLSSAQSRLLDELAQEPEIYGWAVADLPQVSRCNHLALFAAENRPRWPVQQPQYRILAWPAQRALFTPGTVHGSLCRRGKSAREQPIRHDRRKRA